MTGEARGLGTTRSSTLSLADRVPAGALAAMVVATLTAACGGEDPPTATGDARPADLVLEARIGPADGEPAAAEREAFLAADRLAFRLIRLPGEETVVDRTRSFDPGGGPTVIPVEVVLEGVEETFLLDLALSGGGADLFRGSADVVLRAGTTTDVEVPLQPVPADLRAAPDSVRFTSLGDTARATAAVLFATGDTIPDLTATWSSSDPQVVESLGDGLLVSAGEGRARVTARHGAFADTVGVVVEPSVASVSVTPDSATLTALEQTQSFQATAADANGSPVEGVTFDWRSTDPQVVAVDGQGTAAAISNGQAFVVASGAGFSDSARVVVDQRVASLTVTPDTADIPVGDTLDFDATATDANGHTVADAQVDWLSRNTQVVTVDAVGTAVGQSSGSTFVVASAAGVSDSAQVDVFALIGAVPSRAPLARVPVPSGGPTDLPVPPALRLPWARSTTPGVGLPRKRLALRTRPPGPARPR